jgi:5'-methylthioadenosine phosphorylase
MPPILACIAGEEIYRQWEAGRLTGQRLSRHNTPFGLSNEIFLVEDPKASFYLLPRYSPGLAKTSPAKINYRANIYALKDLGVQCVLAWASAGAVTHNLSVGDLVVLSDIIDMTRSRPGTFFEDSPLGYLRQFPVFCPWLRGLAGEVLAGLKLANHQVGIAAVCEGPRLETPAEVRMLATVGAELVTHAFVPEMFLAKELQLCYSAISYIVNYAETGSKHRPFAAGELFAGLAKKSDNQRLASVIASMPGVAAEISLAVGERSKTKSCECDKTMEHNIRTYNLDADWHKWF